MKVDAVIATLWPGDWARANDSRLTNRSKARNRLRKRYAEHLLMQEFKARHPNARCGSCAHFGRMPVSQQRTCILDSDFDGYALTSADKVCRRWKAATQ